MRAMYKSELAAYAGVSTGTLRRWLMPYRQELNEIGVKRKHPTPMTIQLHPQCLLGIQGILRNWTFLIFKQV